MSDDNLDLDVEVGIVGEPHMVSDFLVWARENSCSVRSRAKAGDGFERVVIVYRGPATGAEAQLAEENLHRLWRRHARRPAKIRVSFVPSPGEAWQQKYPQSWAG
ncbi:MAG: hypothetical protein HOV77_05260 [Hamadaea sp.]|uniref:hypothetical protein n=1 Tax=Hamadaea sp. TaxID=2024425 RepID=UPI0017B03E20|nr:hypothetical protein [Hamadaea sp.]NUT18571.1 hypothetical protein [Hamadaea sp.]